MGATNPFRVSDLIAKYGWKVMPYLSNLGPLLLAEAQVLFVDSGHTNALDADDTEHGHSFEKPLATIDYAIGLCTAAERSVILVAPGHNEPLAAATIDFDVSDITCIGIGEGSNRPTIDFDNTASQVIIGANNVHLINLRFMPSIDDIVIGVEVEASVTGTILEKCEWAEMEDTGDEFILGLDIKAGCTDTKVTNCLFRTEVTADAADHAIKLTGASDNVIIEKSRFIGNWATAAIGGDTTLSTDVLIDDCTIKTKNGIAGIVMLTGTTGIIRNVCIESTTLAVDSMITADAMSWFNNYGVTADGAAATIIGGGEAVAAVNTAVSGVVAGSLYDILNDGIGGGYAKATDSLEALRTKMDAYSSPTDVTAAVPVSPTSQSLQDILSKADGTNTYSKTTDSLEAISEALLAGTGCTAAIDADSLDKLVATSDTDQAYPASLASHSILSSIMSATGVPATFDRASDSLEAIADAIAALAFTAAVSQTPTARSLQDILEKDTGGTFNDATDSLEAIADRLIDANIDKLTGAADGGSNVYPDSVVQESVIAFILSKEANPVTTSYNNTTDSLEAIRNRMDALNVADQTDLDAIIVDVGLWNTATKAKTILFGSDTAGATATALGTAQTDLDTLTGTGGANLETATQTQVDNIEADANKIDGATVSTTPVAASLVTFIASGGTSLGRQLPVSTSLVDIIGNFTGAYNGTVPDDNIKAALDHLSKYIVDGDGDWVSGTGLPSNKSIYDVIGTAYIADGGADNLDSIKAHHDLINTAVDAILVDTAAIDPGAKRIHTRTLTNWAAAVADLWDVSAPVKAKIRGVVLVGVANQATNLKISATPTAPGGAVDICANLDCDNDAAGTVYKMNTTVGGAMVEVTGGVSIADGVEVILPAGIVTMTSDANEAGGGSIQWIIEYEPLVAGAVVTNT